MRGWVTEGTTDLKTSLTKSKLLEDWSLREIPVSTASELIQGGGATTRKMTLSKYVNKELAKKLYLFDNGDFFRFSKHHKNWTLPPGFNIDGDYDAWITDTEAVTFNINHPEQPTMTFALVMKIFLVSGFASCVCSFTRLRRVGTETVSGSTATRTATITWFSAPNAGAFTARITCRVFPYVPHTFPLDHATRSKACPSVKSLT